MCPYMKSQFTPINLQSGTLSSLRNKSSYGWDWENDVIRVSAQVQSHPPASKRSQNLLVKWSPSEEGVT